VISFIFAALAALLLSIKIYLPLYMSCPPLPV